MRVVTVVMLNAHVVDSGWWKETNGQKIWIFCDLFRATRRYQQLVDASWGCLK